MVLVIETDKVIATLMYDRNSIVFLERIGDNFTVYVLDLQSGIKTLKENFSMFEEALGYFYNLGGMKHE